MRTFLGLTVGEGVPARKKALSRLTAEMQIRRPLDDQVEGNWNLAGLEKY
jgi:hypothetical protein